MNPDGREGGRTWKEDGEEKLYVSNKRKNKVERHTHKKNVKFGKEESVSKAKVSDKNTEQATELF